MQATLDVPCVGVFAVQNIVRPFVATQLIGFQQLLSFRSMQSDTTPVVLRFVQFLPWCPT